MLRIFCLLIFMVAGPVWAQQQADIYHTEVQLTASDNAESVAKTEGLVNVLIKVSGQRDIANNGVIKKALTQSDRYVCVQVCMWVCTINCAFRSSRFLDEGLCLQHDPIDLARDSELLDTGSRGSSYTIIVVHSWRPTGIRPTQSHSGQNHLR